MREKQHGMAALSDWIEQRRGGWDELNQILQRTGRKSLGVRRLSRSDLKRIGPLYRRAAADLAHLRLRDGDPALIGYLNDLVTRAHGLLYVEQGPGAKRLGRFLLYGFPALLRRRGVYILLAALIFVAGGVVGAAVTIRDPQVGRVFLGERAEETNFYQDLPDTLKDEERTLFSAMLMQNNIRVAILAFAVGILGGFPTLILLFANGLPIGALAVLQHQAGRDLALWSFLLPHGVPELSAIFIAGGAGMIIGHALVAPGELPRRDAITAAGRDAVRLLFGAAAMLVIAGFTESFVSPTGIHPSFKFLYAALMAVGLACYVRLGSHQAKPDAVSAATKDAVPVA